MTALNEERFKARKDIGNARPLINERPDKKPLETWELDGGYVEPKLGDNTTFTKPVEIDIGISLELRTKIAAGLNHTLADTYALYLKTQTFHWNVMGPHFSGLHKMFEQQYQDLANAADLVAERIRALGFLAPGGLGVYAKLTAIKEIAGDPTAEQMIAELIEGHQTIVKKTRFLLGLVETAKDEATMDILTHRLQVHEKAAWMLRSSLKVG